MPHYNIWTCYFTRSEFGPLSPLMAEMRRRNELSLLTKDFTGRPPTLAFLEEHFKAVRPDAVLCGFDRPEMVPVAYVAYHMNIPIIQIFAGDLAGGAWDDADRFAISQYASLLFVSGRKQADRLERALRWKEGLGLAPEIYRYGATHFDDMTAIPPDCFKDREITNIVLYNPPSLATDSEVGGEVREILSLIGDETTVWFEPNGDPRSDFVMEMVKFANVPSIYTRSNMERARFLGYLSRAKRFIGNSSALFYEGPAMGVECVQIGMRNKHRDTVVFEPGASKKMTDKILKFLSEKEGECRSGH